MHVLQQMLVAAALLIVSDSMAMAKRYVDGGPLDTGRDIGRQQGQCSMGQPHWGRHGDEEDLSVAVNGVPACCFMEQLASQGRIPQFPPLTGPQLYQVGSGTRKPTDEVCETQRLH